MKSVIPISIILPIFLQAVTTHAPLINPILYEEQRKIYDAQNKEKKISQSIYTEIQAIPVEEDVNASKACFRIDKITLENSKLIDGEELYAVIKPYLHHCDSMEDINIIVKKINNINIHASEGTYTTETSSESKNASVGLYGTNMGQSTGGFQENEMTTTGTTQRNSQLYAGATANITSAGDTTLAGANIEAKNLALNVGGDLNMQSLQDSQTIEGSSRGGSVSGNVMIGVPTGASANAGETTGERAWVSQTTGINGSQSITVNVGGTTTLTGASITNINEEGQAQGNLEVTTQHLVVNDIQDIDTYEATTAGAGIGSNDGAPSLNSVEYTNNTTDKEQITRATIGDGTINTQTTTGTVNRDT